MAIRSKRFIVTGRVQGVFYRASARRKAREFDVTGYAVNRPDGAVEVLACGTPGSIQQLEEWLWEGPSAAKVEDVVVEDVDLDDIPEDFSID